MKRLRITVAAVLILSLAVCTAGLTIINRILDEAEASVTEIVLLMERGEEAAAREALTAMAERWDGRAGLMETLCEHDDLHAVRERMVQAKICMEYTDMEDFYASMALLGENIEHIRDEEALRLSNLF